VILCAGVSARAAFAADLPDDADRALPCRPTVACTADLAAPGTFEVEGGWSASQEPGERSVSFPFLLKQTFTQLLQLQVGSNGFTSIHGAARSAYFDDVVVGPKIHLRDQGTILPSLALSAEVGIPTFRATGYARNDDAFFTAYASKDIGWLHADWNVGVTAWQLESAKLQAMTALALSTTVVGPVGALVEGYAFSSAAPVAPRDGGIRAGLTLAPRPWLVFDAGGDVGVFPSTRSSTVFVGMTLVPIVFWRGETR
jgi:hypothetical protein